MLGGVSSLMVAKTLPATGDLSLNFLPVLPSISCLPRRSTNKLNSVRKFAPRMGKATPACRKFQVNCRPPMLTVCLMDPQKGMGLPLALVRAGPEAGSVARSPLHARCLVVTPAPARR